MARYRDAIDWIAYNDDTSFLDDQEIGGPGHLSVTAHLVADLFDKTSEQVRDDLIRALKRRERKGR